MAEEFVMFCNVKTLSKRILMTQIWLWYNKIKKSRIKLYVQYISILGKLYGSETGENVYDGCLWNSRIRIIFSCTYFLYLMDFLNYYKTL